MGKKIRAAQLQKAPYTLVIGDREVESERYNVRDRGGTEHEGVPFDRLVERLVEEGVTRRLTQSVFEDA